MSQSEQINAQMVNPELGVVGTNMASAEQSHSEVIWNRYFERLLKFARFQMRGMPKVASDEEDITLSVLKSVCISLREQGGGSGADQDKDELWGLLVLICKRKIANQYAYQRREKRDISRAESIDDSPALMDVLHSKEISPALLADFNDRLESLFGVLEKDMLKRIAIEKVQGYTNAEIATRLGCSLSSVERKLRLIREIWSRECDE